MATDSSTGWEVRESQGKGLGVFARTIIPEGTRILQEQAIFAVDNFTPLEIYKTYSLHSNVSPAFSGFFGTLTHIGHMPAPDTPYTLYQVTAPNSTRLDRIAGEIYGTNWMVTPDNRRVRQIMIPDMHDAARIVAIFDNNCFDIRDAKGARLVKAVFEIASRLNHSCVPNCQISWNHKLQRQCVHAVRDIQEGEELFIAYSAVDLFSMHREMRQRTAYERYGFICNCPACNVDVNAIDAEVSKREQIVECMLGLAKTIVNGNPSAEVDEVLEQILNLMEDEGTETWEKGKVHMKLASIYKQRRNYKDALFHYWMAKKIAKVCFGEDHEQTAGAEAAHDDMLLKA